MKDESKEMSVDAPSESRAAPPVFTEGYQMRLHIHALLALTLFLVGFSPAELTTMVNTTNTAITLQIHHEGVDDPRLATQVIELPAHARRPGPNFRGAQVDATGPDGSVLFHQENFPNDPQRLDGHRDICFEFEYT